jgi:hypothetical protein
MDKRKKQRWFVRAVNGLAGQGFKRSMSPTNGCLYRGPNGTKCAIGHLIRDRDYRPYFEGLPITNCFLILGNTPNNEEQFFLYDLQECHDDSGTPAKMKTALKDFAKTHGLKIPRKLYGA